MLDYLCPPEMSTSRRRLCVILVTEDREEDDEARDQLRQFTRQFKYNPERIKFSYIYRNKQTEFLSSLSSGIMGSNKTIHYYLVTIIISFEDGESPAEPQSHMVIVWRQDAHRLSYSWLSQPFVSGVDHWNTSKQLLQSTLMKLLTSSQPLAYQTMMKVSKSIVLDDIGLYYNRALYRIEFQLNRLT